MSGRKNVLTLYQNIKNGDMSQASITSAVTNIQHLDNISVQLNWTGSPVGTFAVQVSLDYAQDVNGNVTNSGNWAALPISPVPVTSMGSPIILDLNQLASPWIRVVYTKTSGTGTLNSFISAKQL